MIEPQRFPHAFERVTIEPLERVRILRPRQLAILFAEDDPAMRRRVFAQQLASGDADARWTDAGHDRVAEVGDAALAADARETPDVLAPFEVAVEQDVIRTR